jgi:hypothetical protein
MLPLDLLRVPFPRAVHVRVQMPGVRPPMIRIKAREPKRLQQRFEPQTHLVLPTPKNIRQDGPRVVMLGRRKARYPAARFLTPPVEHRTCGFDRIRRST